MSDERPIGLLDSGVGGLTVVKEVMNQIPNEDIVFIGDEANMPYGTKTTEEIIKYTREMVKYLIDENCKVIIYACNTATARALPKLQREFDIPMFGVIKPGARAAAEITKNKQVGVIGTQATIDSKSYSLYVDDLDPEINVIGVAAQSFVKLVERDQTGTDKSMTKVAETLEPYKETKIDTLILGCTHFPMIAKDINSYLGDSITLVNPSIETVKEVSTYLKENDMFGSDVAGNIILHTTANLETFKKLATDWLEGKFNKVDLVNLEDNNAGNNHSN
ncbi:glutamate racemase [Companilactobacillus mishanensis]|uniref:Glutamate racemase n=1 Tax=Companilactobacillus mishanensis TaxID=2486008 RepID=A0ABW9P682_9LACO|nr:glutamate racemase [Companilactobacillus mishanensis]MQS44778.1 glutamate racemase [Companilactobacillus mishanensis]